MKFNFKQFKKIFISTVLLFSVAFLALNIYTNVNYYSQFTSKEKIDQYFANNEIIPNGTKMLGAGGETVVFLTTTGAGTWTVPEDWNSDNNTIECIGGGSHGAGYNNQNGGGSGGGGGAYAKKNNLSLTPGESINYQVGAVVTDTWFKSTSDVLAKGAGNALAWNYSGGQASESVGDLKYSGGNGGYTYSYNRCGGGGGAAGPNGNGNNGVDAISTKPGNGGDGDAGYGGSGGNYLAGGNGGNGTEWDSTHGSGGGGAGSSSSGQHGGSGGNYGAGGGAQGDTALTSNYGVQGIIVITYTPASSGNFNMFFFY